MVSILPYPTPSHWTVDILCPDPGPNDKEDMEVPDQQALLDACMTRLAKESDSDFHSLSQLLANLPDPTHGEVEAMYFAEATVGGSIPEA